MDVATTTSELTFDCMRTEVYNIVYHKLACQLCHVSTVIIWLPSSNLLLFNTIIMCLVPCGLPVAAFFLFIELLGRQHAMLMEVDQL